MIGDSTANDSQVDDSAEVMKRSRNPSPYTERCSVLHALISELFRFINVKCTADTHSFILTYNYIVLIMLSHQSIVK